MPNQRSLSEQIEALRLEVERTRAEIDRLRYLDESHRTFLQSWQIQVAPIHEEQERSRELGAGYAQVGIKSMFILNGGALVALPAFVKMAGTGLATETAFFASSVASFVIGLVLITVTTLFAYLSLDAEVAALRRRGNVLRLDLIKGCNPVAFTKDQEQERHENEEGREKFGDLASQFTKVAVGLAIASLVAFIAGAVIGIAILA